MKKEIHKGIFVNEIILPNNPLKFLSSYVIQGDNPLIIDTGFNQKECSNAFYAGIEELEIDLKKAKVLATHLHSDHCGLIGELEKNCEIIMGEKEAKAICDIGSVSYKKKFEEYIYMYDLQKFGVTVDNHPGYAYRPNKPSNITTVKENDIIKVGDYEFTVLFMPGHTPGHITLYEKKEKILFGGDVILANITPTVTFWGFEEDILKTYLSTLKRISEMDIDVIFTSHRSFIYDYKKRVQDLFDHHEERLAEVEKITSENWISVADTASKMTWSIRAKNWEEFPKAQKWFATGEAMAHLEHLYKESIIDRINKDGVLFYRKK